MAPTILSFYNEIKVLEQIRIEMSMTNLSDDAVERLLGIQNELYRVVLMSIYKFI